MTLSDAEADFDFYFGLLFVSVSTTVLSLSILATSVFKQGVIGKAWLLLVIAITSLTIADAWYYYLETFDQYSLEHPVNLFWYVGYWLAVYALIKHKNVI